MCMHQTAEKQTQVIDENIEVTASVFRLLSLAGRFVYYKCKNKFEKLYIEKQKRLLQLLFDF